MATPLLFTSATAVMASSAQSMMMKQKSSLFEKEKRWRSEDRLHLHSGSTIEDYLIAHRRRNERGKEGRSRVERNCCWCVADSEGCYVLFFFLVAENETRSCLIISSLLVQDVLR